MVQDDPRRQPGPPLNDVVIVGGGIVGLATAMAVLRRRPETRLTLLDKEPKLAFHQTGHNSGVIHSGIYYRPGSLKAQLCVAGHEALLTFCRTRGIPIQQCGKVVVAIRPGELPRLEALYQRGVANGVPGLSLIEPARLRELEPAAAGLKALHVPSVGIVDYSRVARAMAETITTAGGVIRTSARVTGVVQRTDELVVQTTAGEVVARAVITCGGLYADRLARLSGAPVALHVVPFRGEYYELVPAKRHLVRGVIYPVPDPALPFLGVHLTRMMDGRVEAGPSAVLALAREGYRNTAVNLRDVAELLRFPGFWRMAARHWRYGAEELVRSFSKRAFVRAVQRLVPAVHDDDLVPAPAGVRAQAVDRAGRLLDDFHLVRQERMLHVCNAPSPAATASLAIGEYVADQTAQAFGWPCGTRASEDSSRSRV